MNTRFFTEYCIINLVFLQKFLECGSYTPALFRETRFGGRRMVVAATTAKLGLRRGLHTPLVAMPGAWQARLSCASQDG